MVLSLTRRLAILLAFFAVGSLLSHAAQAARFRNSYVSFELPNKWRCELIDTEWVCRNGEPGDKLKEAIIILTAKEVGPSDSLPAYDIHLKTPRTLPSALGTPTQSQILNVTQRKINNHVWVDGMHLSSEVRDYYTRYVATTKDKIAILVTFSAHKLHYSRYVNDFFKAIESLQVLNTRNLVNAGPGTGGGGDGTLGPIGGIDPGMGPDSGEEFPEEGSGGSDSTTLAILAIAAMLAAFGVFLLTRKKKRR